MLYSDLSDRQKKRLVSTVLADAVYAYSHCLDSFIPVDGLVVATPECGGVASWSVATPEDITSEVVEQALLNLTDSGDYITVSARLDPIYVLP